MGAAYSEKTFETSEESLPIPIVFALNKNNIVRSRLQNCKLFRYFWSKSQDLHLKSILDLLYVSTELPETIIYIPHRSVHSLVKRLSAVLYQMYSILAYTITHTHLHNIFHSSSLKLLRNYP
jgi:hypothetical protein